MTALEDGIDRASHLRAQVKGRGFGLLLALTLISVAAFILYFNTFSSPFVLDDLAYIQENGSLRDLSNFWPPTNTRFITYLSFALNYRFGGPGVFGFHVVNTLIHIFNGLLIFQITCLCFRSPRLSGFLSSGNGDDSKGIMSTPYLLALSVGLIFTVHPVQTESVTYLTQRFASLSTLMYLLGLFLFITARVARRANLRHAFYALSIIVVWCAQITKEICFTLPFIITLFEFTFFTGNEKLTRRLARLVPYYVALLIIPFVLLYPWPVEYGAGGVSEMIMDLQVEEMTTLSRFDYLITQFRVLITYLRLLVLPVAQNFEYDYQVYTSLFSPAPLASLLFLLGLFTFGVYIYIRSFALKSPYLLLAAFGISWFFITISIESSIIPIQHVIFEHRLYLPSFGAFLALFSLAYYLIDRYGLSTHSTVAVVLLVVTLLPLSVATVKRNALWADELTLYEDMVVKSPKRVPGHTFLGRIYHERGRLDSAVKEFRTSIELKPDDVLARFDLANVLREQEKMEEAIGEFKAILIYAPEHIGAMTNLGTAYLVTGRLTEAATEYRRALRYDPGHKEAHYNIHLAYKGLGDNTRAEAHFRQYQLLNRGQR
ncbi:MAG: tetratricopeptide repeat protein [Proteobacteria bacterium]|nr:tetratricopeptide repeat protein [Pseudomonadota bacterium]